MKYAWLRNNKLSCDELSTLLGIPVKSISTGVIPTGEKTVFILPDGSKETVDKTQDGIEIEFETTPTEEQLRKLDLVFNELKREGGWSLPQEIDALKARVGKLESKML